MIRGTLAQNLELVRDALSSLVSTQVEFDISVNLLPEPISQACQKRRQQAVHFMNQFLSQKIEKQESLEDNASSVGVHSVVASWQDISIIYHFLKTQL